MSSAESYGDPETRVRILETTLRLVPDAGVNLKLSEVAEHAGVSRQAIYLHFGDRTGLFVALVQHMDETMDLGESLNRILQATSGAEVIRLVMETHSQFNTAIDPVALVLEGAQYHDEALGAAWRDRMRFRHQAHRNFIELIDSHNDLADHWTIEAAADLFHAATLLGPWRELTRELGWTNQQYVEHMTGLLSRALLKPHDVV